MSAAVLEAPVGPVHDRRVVLARFANGHVPGVVLGAGRAAAAAGLRELLWGLRAGPCGGSVRGEVALRTGVEFLFEAYPEFGFVTERDGVLTLV